MIENNHLSLSSFCSKLFSFNFSVYVYCKYSEHFEIILTTQLKSKLKAYNVIRRSSPMQIKSYSRRDIKKSLQRTKFTSTKIQIISRYTTKVRKNL